MKWRELLQETVSPDIHYLSPAVASVVFCLLVMLLCVIMHNLSNVILPGSIKLYALDFFKSIAIFTYPLAFGLTRTYHGHIGYCVIMVPINVISLLLMTEGSISPVDNFLFVIKGKQTLWRSVLRIVIQVNGAISAFYLAQKIMQLEFHEDFKYMLSNACTSDLKVTVFLGFLLEMMGTAWDMWIWSLPLSRYHGINLLIKMTNSALVVCSGVHYTGMYNQPALATGYTFGCHGTSNAEHVFVYWIGPFIGGYVADYITENFNTKLFSKEVMKKDFNNGKSRDQEETKKTSTKNLKEKYN
ncbi:aquaporin-11-like [Mytilus californianus]|uniref:aquaporin-11-like n=1 Tax=Mytilus californianus TaxID=6549 RepID=UPI0022481EC8|nr:aquaporin-11-like [Mytilus californianus]